MGDLNPQRVYEIEFDDGAVEANVPYTRIVGAAAVPQNNGHSPALQADGVAKKNGDVAAPAAVTQVVDTQAPIIGVVVKDNDEVPRPVCCVCF